ncbi:bacterioferritin-associated ferredoxin [Methylonatrum kenyense]|uniref:bacterioferritin-associated ferredoxin n=1 Tax=Methylonatrum kenyense TaxID=455253 RepID=UPI0020C16CEC|nr:bacterioferritin-associated ferredoxin [Methylonatrum kenyense]MCK8516154.1 bacterioferritin-associated ferredoxin [Methylonatrum kenyense]
MYVCLCNGITDRQIRQAVEDGASSMRELRRQLGVCGNCGRCGPEAREILCQTQCRVAAEKVTIDLPPVPALTQPAWAAG